MSFEKTAHGTRESNVHDARSVEQSIEQTANSRKTSSLVQQQQQSHVVEKSVQSTASSVTSSTTTVQRKVSSSSSSSSSVKQSIKIGGSISSTEIDEIEF